MIENRSLSVSIPQHRFGDFRGMRGIGKHPQQIVNLVLAKRRGCVLLYMWLYLRRHIITYMYYK